MDSPDGMWRTQHYIAGLRDIENILGTSERGQGQCPDTSVPAATLPSRGTRDTTVGSALPINPPTRVPMDPSQAYGFSTQMTPPTYGLSTQVTSPTTAAPASVSTAPSASVSTAPSASTTSTPNVQQCPECKQPFSGRPSDVKKNLDRHMSTKHSQKAGVKCPQEDCRYTTRRTDNFPVHLKKTHKITEPQLYDHSTKKTKKRALALAERV